MSLLVDVRTYDGSEVVVFSEVFQALQRNRDQHNRKRPGGTSGTFSFFSNSYATSVRSVSAKRQCETAANSGECIKDWNFWSSLLK